VDVRSGSDRVVHSDNGKPGYNVVGFVQQDIFVVGCGGWGCWGPLSRVDATTGTLIKVSDRLGRWVISGRVAWVGACSSATGPPECYGPNPGPDQIVRIDLTNGSEQVWDHESGIDLIGVDGGGMPLARSNSSGKSLLVRIGAPGQAEPIFSVAVDEQDASSGFESPIVADGLGTWLYVLDQGPSPGQSPPGRSQGLYLYANATGVRKVSDFPGVPVGPVR
jgi:hypothetical protein